MVPKAEKTPGRERFPRPPEPLEPTPESEEEGEEAGDDPEIFLLFDPVETTDTVTGLLGVLNRCESSRTIV